MQRGSTVFLRATLVILGFIVLVLCALVLPTIHREWAGQYPEIASLLYPVLIGLTATTIPFFVALYQAWKLLNYIDKNEAFSELSVHTLKNIKYCALIIGGLYAMGMPLIYYMAEKDDAPGLIIIGAGLTFAPVVIAVFAAVAQRLFQNAMAIKLENDLTV